MISKVFADDEFRINDIKNTNFYQKTFGGFKFEGKNISDIFSAFLPYIYYLAGLILFGAIIIAGFKLLTSAGDPKKTAQAKAFLTNAIVGFLIIFISWWLIQIIQIIFHLQILG